MIITETGATGTATLTGVATVVGGVAVTPHSGAFTASGVTTGTGAVTVQAAGGGSNKNYVQGMQVWNSGTVQTVLTFNDSSTWKIVAQAGVATEYQFDPPLATAAATALTFTPSAGVTSVGANVQGYVAP